ncbi:putative enzyme related to lactoylglutathione lyase [Saccharothrix coeruleofusca]|uniref:VOC family protein n=1 Tax=Saccharothrix coeruleofusca TaxID=33919 RepID=UPI001AE79526|nr:VOC family protein [Saccharothrix coeruleofusca]MBP2336625.1 putative enzyme related to lactoylglutathione lyase [Saccharothrix coeruleofusca]
MTAVGRLAAVTLDCADAKNLAAFYHGLTGLEIVHNDDDGCYLSGPEGGVAIAIQRVADYRPPQWPTQDVPQQIHLDIDVADLDEAERQVLELGGTKPEPQPNAERWRVMLDPAGHPFCLARFGGS